ncbi:MAG: hypothetical protein LBV74_01740 [Tannerella sp.]|nr:hypothetical protein [Tannerella sp.]
MKYFIIIFLIGPILSLTSASAQTPDEIFSWLPEVKGWDKPAFKEVFNADNLFDRINGAAPLFIENGFQEMTACDYTKGDDYITIQVYRHATPEDAFGMYASERSSDLMFYEIGGEAHGDNSSLFFFAGPVYVKIRSSVSGEETGEAMREIAGTLAYKVAPDAGYPMIIKSFPEENKIPHTEAYITSNYIGHEFLNKVFVCQYNKNGLTYQLFVISAENNDAAKEILNKYFTFTKQPLEFGEGILLIKDRYNGDIPCLWKNQYLIGIFNENGESVPDAETILNKSSVVNLFGFRIIKSNKYLKYL